MKPHLVQVIWIDAQGSATRVYAKERDHAPIEMITVGWLLDHDKAGVSVANERFIEDGTENFRGHTFVPAGMVKRVKRLRGTA